MLGRSQTERLLKRALSLSSAGGTEVVLLGLEAQLTRFANNTIHQHVAESNHYVVVRAAPARRDLRFTHSYVEALGREKRHVWSDPGIRSAPPLKLAAFNFTS